MQTTSNMTLAPSTLLLLAACAFDPEPTTDEEVLARLTALETSNAALEAEIERMSGELSDCQATLVDHQAQLDSLSGELATASGLPRFIDIDLTLEVPTEYEDINIALGALSESVISQNATVTIQVADGSYSYDEPITLSHENGDRIQIVGNVSDPTAVSLTFALSGFEVSNGHSLGLLQGMTLLGNGYTSGTPYGVLVQDNGLATVSDVHTSSFWAGFAAYNGGVLFADGTSDDGSYISYQAIGASVLRATDASAAGAKWYGFAAERSAYMNADKSAVAGAGRDCYVANGGNMDVEAALADSCAWAGFRAVGLASLNAAGADVTSSTEAREQYGFAATYGGYVVATNIGEFDHASVTGVEYGYYAEFAGLINANYSESSDNTYGYRADWGGSINAQLSTSPEDTPYSPSTSSGISSDVYIWY